MDHHHDSSSTRDETLSCQRPSPLPRRRYVTSMRGVDVKKSRSHRVIIFPLPFYTVINGESLDMHSCHRSSRSIVASQSREGYVVSSFVSCVTSNIIVCNPKCGLHGLNTFFQPRFGVHVHHVKRRHKK